jgi:hypothetical protein
MLTPPPPRQVREEEFDLGTLRRLEERKTAMLEAKSTRFAEIQARRIKTMRQVGHDNRGEGRSGGAAAAAAAAGVKQ